jgi:SAM-dependent methyltransferase
MAEQQGAGRLRSAYDDMAALYDEARPSYPEALFDDLATLSGLGPGARVLEIGCGTGQATLPLARRGYRVLGVELGENLAAMARIKLSDYPETRVLTSSFEDWPLEERAFDLVVSAQAFHWVDPEIRFRKSVRALRDGGSLALLYNCFDPRGDSEGFGKALSELYRREAPELFGKRRRLPRRLTMVLRQISRRVAPEQLAENRRLMTPPTPVADKAAEIEGSGLFGRPEVRVYPFRVTYDAESYLRLLSTFWLRKEIGGKAFYVYTGNIGPERWAAATVNMGLDEGRMEGLFAAVARLIDEGYGGRVVKGYRNELYVARRR